MNGDDRLGNRDVEAAALFAAARSFRPSARGRRRALRALGLPIGLSFFGSGLAHAAYVLASSLKGWAIVAGVAATVGAAGSVVYVATAPGNAHQARRRSSGPALAAPVLAQPRSNLPLPSSALSPLSLPVVNLPAVGPSLPNPAQPRSIRPEPRGLPGRRLADGGRSPLLPAKARLAEGSIEAAPSAADVAPPPVDREPASADHEPPEALAPSGFQVSPRSAPPLMVPATPPMSSPLKEELTLVAEAQARLRASDWLGAFAALDRHARLYPEGALVEEVALLRVRTLVSQGERQRAREAAEAFLQRHPASPLVARFRALIKTP